MDLFVHMCAELTPRSAIWMVVLHAVGRLSEEVIVWVLNSHHSCFWVSLGKGPCDSWFFMPGCVGSLWGTSKSLFCDFLGSSQFNSIGHTHHVGRAPKVPSWESKVKWVGWGTAELNCLDPSSGTYPQCPPCISTRQRACWGTALPCNKSTQTGVLLRPIKCSPAIRILRIQVLTTSKELKEWTTGEIKNWMWKNERI